MQIEPLNEQLNRFREVSWTARDLEAVFSNPAMNPVLGGAVDSDSRQRGILLVGFVEGD